MRAGPEMQRNSDGEGEQRSASADEDVVEVVMRTDAGDARLTGASQAGGAQYVRVGEVMPAL